MAKFIKRLGTKAYKYAVDVHIDKVYIDHPTATRLKIVLKRGNLLLTTVSIKIDIVSGPHKVETKTQPTLDYGIATFSETLSISATLYYDKKRISTLHMQRG